MYKFLEDKKAYVVLPQGAHVIKYIEVTLGMYAEKTSHSTDLIFGMVSCWGGVTNI